jgi:hypothetical protein
MTDKKYFFHGAKIRRISEIHKFFLGREGTEGLIPSLNLV